MSRAVAICFLALGALLPGCALPDGGRAGGLARDGMHVLTGEEVVIAEDAASAPAWITAARSLRLHFQPAGELPRQVVFLYRERGKKEWILGPSWRAGEPPPVWIAPREGCWELRAEPYSGSEPRAPAAEKSPSAVVACDWSAPRVRIDRALPDVPQFGGGSIPLRWQAQDEFPGAESVTVELRDGSDDDWEAVAEGPNTGFLDWQPPNRPLAGARVRLRVHDSAGNTSWAEIPGHLTVESVAPAVRVPERFVASDGPCALPYEASLGAGATSKRAELWITEDGGATWNLAGYDHDATAPFDIELAEGRYGFHVVVEDRDGNRSAYPAPGDAPSGELVVDRTPPVVEWGDPAVAPTGERSNDGQAMLAVRVPYRVRDLLLDTERLEFDYRTETAPWIAIPGEHGSDGSLSWSLPERGEEPVTLRVRGSDLAGHGLSAELSLHPREILNPPVLSFESGPVGWQRGGSDARVAWRSDWEAAEGGALEISFRAGDGGWRIAARGLDRSGEYMWRLPEESLAQIELRLMLRARDGRELVAVSPQRFSIDAGAPIARILGPSSAAGEATDLLVELLDAGGSGIELVDLYARKEGSERWELACTARGTPDRLPFRPPSAGLWQLLAVATDGAGNRGREPDDVAPADLFSLRIEHGVQGIELLSFQDGGTFAGGSSHLVFLGWRGPNPLGGIVDLEYSPDNGKTWREIGSVRLGQDRRLWTLPDEEIAACRVRAVAREASGRRTLAQSRLPFAIDITPPEVALSEVTAAEDGDTVLCYDEPEGGGRAARLWVYYTRDGGTTWERWAEPFPSGAPIRVPLPAGKYGFVVRGEDEVGNVAPPPIAGIPPAMSSAIGAPQGVTLELLHPRGGLMAGGSRHYVFWALDGAAAAFSSLPVRLEYRIDGEEAWSPIAEQLPPSGKRAWTVPEREGAVVHLRAVAFDLEGKRYEATTAEPVVVDSEEPLVLYMGPDRSNERPTVVEYKSLDQAASGSIELWVRAVSTPDWTLAATASLGDALSAEIPDGMYRAVLVAVDGAGNRGRSPGEPDVVEHDLLVDTVPPLLEVDGAGSREQVFRQGDWLLLRPRVQDRHLSAFPVDIRLSEDGGATYRLLAEYHPNGDDFSYRLNLRAGLYHVKVTATDLATNRTSELVPIQVLPAIPAVVILTNPEGGVLEGSAEMHLEWESRGADPLEKGMRIDFSADGQEWIPAFEDLTADGSVVWTLPAVDSNRCRLRFTLTTRDGLSGRAETGDFTVSTTLPKVRVRGVRPARAGEPAPGGDLPDR